MNDLNLLYARHNRQGPAGEILSHPIRYHELTMVFKGSLIYRVNGQQTVLQAGDVLFMARDTVRYRADSPEDTDYISFNFETEVPPGLPGVIRNGVNRQIQLLVAAFDEISSKLYLDNREKIGHILCCILLVLADRVKTAGYNPMTVQIMRYLHNHFAERITLEKIGELTAFSPVYCDTVFRQEVGKSIIDYLLDIRVDEAKKLLIDGNLSIAQVAERTGFQDANYFCRVFKKRTSDTPSGYRKRLGSG